MYRCYPEVETLPCGLHDEHYVLAGNHTLLTREYIRWLKDDLEKIELKISPISTLDEHLEEFLNIVVEVYVKNKEYQGKNYATPYINKKLNIEIPPDLNSDMSGGSDSAGAGGVDDCLF